MTNKRISNSDNFLEPDENRINWERKQRSKRPRDLDDLLDDDIEVLPKKGKKHKKHREYIYDEERGHVIVKRKRRRQRERFYDEWDE
ncbi:MAG: hypothetical protein CUN56_13030 [Phototrophicales bacterium]|nr:MAG: hypothetical protein CUN56_13030 [Phototrophicales bacterium]RMG76456.1 MAG: hypothetical protein D6711_03885 [Chloroflexota bacterium]